MTVDAFITDLHGAARETPGEEMAEEMAEVGFFGRVDSQLLEAYIWHVNAGVETLWIDIQTAQDGGKLPKTTQEGYKIWRDSWQLFALAALEEIVGDFFGSDQSLESQTRAFENELMGWRARYDRESGLKAPPYGRKPPPSEQEKKGPTTLGQITILLAVLLVGGTALVVAKEVRK